MRAVLQRVISAKVTVNDRFVSKIRRGLLVFLGMEKGDTTKDADYLAEKILNLRIFEDKAGKMNLSLLDVGAEMLVVSQFTLLADCLKGRRPSFTNAEFPDRAKPLYDYFVNLTKNSVGQVAEGEFQAEMTVELVNDGPVTMILDSRRLF